MCGGGGGGGGRGGGADRLLREGGREERVGYRMKGWKVCGC